MYEQAPKLLNNLKKFLLKIPNTYYFSLLNRQCQNTLDTNILKTKIILYIYTKNQVSKYTQLRYQTKYHIFQN